MEAVEDGLEGPVGLGEHALQGAGGGAVDGLAQVLGVAAFAALNEESSEVLLAATSDFSSAEEGAKREWKLVKVART